MPLALAERMEKEPFKIDLWTGASVGDEADGALTRANVVLIAASHIKPIKICGKA